MPKVKAVVLISSLSILFSFGLAKAEEQKPIKIGYVYAQRILEETRAGKKIKRELDNLAKEKRAKLESLKEEILKLDEELAQKELLLSIEAKSNLEDDIRRKQLEIKRYQEDSLMVLKNFEKDSLKKINDTAMKIIREIGEKEEYSMILEVRESNILYAAPGIDITDKVIEAYDRQTSGENEIKELPGN